MSLAFAHAQDDPAVPDEICDPAAPGVHILRRSGAPPIRLTGRRIYERRGRFGYSIAVWDIRSPGYVLSYLCPTTWQGEAHALRVPDIATAANVLEDVCKALKTQPPQPVFAGTAELLDNAIWTLQLHSRIEHFRALSGRAIADWSTQDSSGVWRERVEE